MKTKLNVKQAAKAAAEKIKSIGSKHCVNDHPIKAENANAADLKRTGKYFCDPCIKMYTEKAKKARKKAAKPSAPVAAATRRARPASKPQPTLVPRVPVPNDMETALKIGLQTAIENANDLKLDDTAQKIYGKKLMGMLAANFGITDFQVRKPVLVFDERLARAGLMQVAQA